ncbi:hypothetical protein ACH5RR_031662 [Cinchona calisaya]|uniref:Uncharacterized protein n=1 Tax=Cinchona calisaya TaxID=153742 RepID=A0ABD2YJC2_9GENT
MSFSVMEPNVNTFGGTGERKISEGEMEAKTTILQEMMIQSTHVYKAAFKVFNDIDAHQTMAHQNTCVSVAFGVLLLTATSFSSEVGQILRNFQGTVLDLFLSIVMTSCGNIFS